MRPVHTIRANLKSECRISCDEQAQVALAGYGCESGSDACRVRRAEVAMDDAPAFGKLAGNAGRVGGSLRIGEEKYRRQPSWQVRGGNAGSGHELALWRGLAFQRHQHD